MAKTKRRDKSRVVLRTGESQRADGTYHYNKVLALVTSISAFLFFKSVEIGYSKIINTIAASTFGVLLIHANSDTMRRWLWQDVLNNVGAYKSGNVVIHAVVSVILVYVVCSLIDICRRKLLEAPLVKRLE